MNESATIKGDDNARRDGQIAQQRGPHAILYAVSLLTDETSAHALYAWAKRTHASFPNGSSSLLVARCLHLAGFSVPYAPTASSFASLLIRYGFRALTAEQAPQRGDIYLAEHQVGFVAFRMVGKDDRFLAADHIMPNCRPYERLLNDPRGYVQNFLRVPT